MIEPGDTVRLIRKRVRSPGSSTDPTHCQMWETIELPPDKQKLGLVIKVHDGVAQLTVLCNGKQKYWFFKNVEKI